MLLFFFLCGLLPWVRLATCPKTSAACLVAVDFQLAHPNSSLLLLLLLLLLHLLGAVLAVASILLEYWTWFFSNTCHSIAANTQ